MDIKAIVKICDCFCERFRLLNKEKWVLFYKCNVKRVTFIKKDRKDSFGRKSNGVDIFPNNIDIHRKNSKILQRKQYFAQSFEKMVQIAIKDAEGIS